MIKALEKELARELRQNQSVHSGYKDELREMEKDKIAIEDLKNKSDKIEQKQSRKEIDKLRKENDLDMVP